MGGSKEGVQVIQDQMGGCPGDYTRQMVEDVFRMRE